MVRLIKEALRGLVYRHDVVRDFSHCRAEDAERVLGQALLAVATPLLCAIAGIKWTVYLGPGGLVGRTVAIGDTGRTAGLRTEPQRRGGHLRLWFRW